MQDLVCALQGFYAVTIANSPSKPCQSAKVPVPSLLDPDLLPALHQKTQALGTMQWHSKSSSIQEKERIGDA